VEALWMKAVAVREVGGIDRLEVMDLPVPEPATDEVVVRVHAAGVNEVDGMFREGYLDSGVRPLIMGSDFSGVISRVGPDVTDVAVGDEVYGYKLLGNGTYADFTVVRADWVARKPRNISHTEAAGFPCVGLTAYQALVDGLDVTRDEVVLITGAAGGVGTVAVQLALSRGARVLTTAGERNRDYLLGLGVDAVVDYRDGDWTEAVRQLYPNGVDAVLTTRGGETKHSSPRVLRDGGRLVWISGDDKGGPPMERMIAGRYVGGMPSRETLDALTALIEAGQLRLPLEHVYGFDEATAAQVRVATGHVRGKLVIDVSGSATQAPTFATTRSLPPRPKSAAPQSRR
jgi:NADPH:quinone reductase-like Zn-dependent oxidoreductase